MRWECGLAEEFFLVQQGFSRCNGVFGRRQDSCPLVRASIGPCSTHGRFRRVSDSRLVTFGKSCRSLVLGLMSGLGHVADVVFGIQKEPGYHLNCVAHMSAHVKKFIFTLSMCSHTSDSDDRVALRLSSFESVVVEELHLLANQPDYVWGHLTRCLGDLWGYDFKSSTLSEAHAGAGFAAERLFSVAGHHPWKLAIGDIRANLEELDRQTDVPPPSPRRGRCGPCCSWSTTETSSCLAWHS